MAAGALFATGTHRGTLSSKRIGRPHVLELDFSHPDTTEESA